MIVLDTSIISTFALIGAMDLLYALFLNEDQVTPAVYTELVVGAVKGAISARAVEQVESGRLKLCVLTAEEFMHGSACRHRWVVVRRNPLCSVSHGVQRL